MSTNRFYFSACCPGSQRSRGIALPMVVLLIAVLFTVGFTISRLLQGVQKQMRYTDASLRVQYIAESMMNELLSRLLAKPWEQRWFRDKPDSQAGVNYERGSYSYFLHDTPGRNNSVDLWVRASFGDNKRNFFWRIAYDQGLLSGLAQGVPLTRLELPDAEAPPPGTNDFSQYTAIVDSHLLTRQANRAAADSMAKNLKPISPPPGAIPEELGSAQGPGGADATSQTKTSAINIVIPKMETVSDDIGEKIDGPITQWIDKKHTFNAEPVKAKWRKGKKGVKDNAKKRYIGKAQKQLRETLKEINEEMRKSQEKDEGKSKGSKKKDKDDDD